MRAGEDGGRRQVLAEVTGSASYLAGLPPAERVESGLGHMSVLAGCTHPGPATPDDRPLLPVVMSFRPCDVL